MRQITSVSDLKDAISELEFNRAVHRRMLKDSLNSTIESLKPGNVIKNAFSNPDLLSNILPAIVGMGAGFISKKMKGKIVSGSGKTGKLKRLLIGFALYGVTKVLIKNPDASRNFSQRIMNTLFN